MRTLLTLSALVATACTSHHTVSDAGQVCVYASTDNDYRPWLLPTESRDPVDFRAGDRIVVEYALDDCFSSSCTSDRAASCEVIREGNTLTIHTTASWSEKTVTGGCTADCRFLTARCESEPLVAGTYRIVHGDDELSLTVPSTTEPPCTFPFE